MKDNEEIEEILFGGNDSDTIAEECKFRKPSNPSREQFSIADEWVKIASLNDENKQLYGDPEGATLEQAWRSQKLITGRSPICLLAIRSPKVSTINIREIERMSPNLYVNLLIQLLIRSNNVAFSVLYYDGKNGHAITVIGFDRESSRFIYGDSWPGGSLLRKKCNHAGVDAKLIGNGYWSITDVEMERIVYATFIPHYIWYSYKRIEYNIEYNYLKRTDFWLFFCVREVSRKDEGVTSEITLAPGNYQSEVNMKLRLNSTQTIVEGVLRVKEAG